MTAANEAGSSSQTSAAFTVTLLDVVKYYDKNTNGRSTRRARSLEGSVGSRRTTPKSLKVDPGVYQVTEASPTQTNWRRTTPAPVRAAAAATHDRSFGNVCVGAGGSKGLLGNKNSGLVGGRLARCLNLNANGSTWSSQLQTWPTTSRRTSVMKRTS